MKKYFYIFKTEIMSNFQYVTNILGSFIIYFILIFIFYNLWAYLYSDPSQLINGYSFKQMVWYVIITEILWYTLSGRKLHKQICEDVKSGNITYNLNKPYSYIGYLLSSFLGSSIIRFVMFIIAGFTIGLIFLGGFPNINIISLLLVIISSLLATTISILIVIALGLLSFFIEDAHPFWWLYSKLILVLGTTFPIEYFPKAIQKVASYTPVYVVSYGPAKLFVDFSFAKAGGILFAQVIYIAICYLICALIYRKGVKKLHVNGG